MKEILNTYDISKKVDIKSGAEVGESILDLFFNTPIIKLNKLTDDSMANVYVKLESFSPGGSVKDRIALAMIEHAERSGLINKNTVIIEATSGNTGIGISLVCAVKGYKCIIVTPETMSIERRYILESYGSEVIITPSEYGIEGCIKKAREIAKKIPNSIILDQFSNQANPYIHQETTAKEIIKTLGCNINAFVCGVGTGGTITGVGRVLKSICQNIKIIAVEPSNSSILQGGEPGVHRINGIGAGFIPHVLDMSIIDNVISVTDMDAFKTMQALAKAEGILCGISSGASTFASLKVAKMLGPGKNVLTILPDTGERYFSIKQYFEF